MARTNKPAKKSPPSGNIVEDKFGKDLEQHIPSRPLEVCNRNYVILGKINLMLSFFKSNSNLLSEIS